MERRRLLILLLLTMIGAVAFGQLKRYDADFVLSKKNFLTTIPIEIERGQIYLSVDINDKTFRFKLDTGASQGVIYDDVELEGIKEVGFIRSEDATGQSQQVKTVELPPFRIGDLTVIGFEVQRMKRNIVRKGEDGIIGFALFNKGVAAKIDTRDKTMTLTDRKSLYKKEMGEVMRYTLKWHVPYVKVSPFEGVEEDVLFDTGSPMPYAVNAQSFEEMTATNPLIKEQIEGTTYGSRAIGHFGSERSNKITLLAIRQLKIGGFEMREIHSETVQGNSHIGTPLLKYGAMIINPFRKQLIFQPYDGATSCVIANHRPDLFIVERNGHAMIGMVMEQSKAYAAGFRQGQIIERVDGKPVSFEAFNRYRWVKGQEYEFTIRIGRDLLTTIRAFWPLYYNQL